MNEPLRLLLAGAEGAVLGVIIFGGLWWTIRRGLSSDRPALWFASSLVLRMGLALIGFYLIAAGHWERLLMSLLGFVMARSVVTWLTRPMQKVRHAP